MRQTGLRRRVLFSLFVLSFGVTVRAQSPAGGGGGVPYPDVRALMAQVLPPEAVSEPRVSADAPGTYAGIGIAITNAEHQLVDNSVMIVAEPTGDGSGVPYMVKSGTPLLVPVDDGGIDNGLQYVLFKNGREVERGDIDLRQNRFRYSYIPFGPIARGIRVGPAAFTPRSPAGDYEVQLEWRSLSVQMEYFSSARNAWGYGPRKTTGEAATIVSNRIPLTLHSPATLTADSIADLARILADADAELQTISSEYTTEDGGVLREDALINGAGGAGWRLAMAGAVALPVVLADYDSQHPTWPQLTCLDKMDLPEAQAAIQLAADQGDEMASRLLAASNPKTLDVLLSTATGKIGEDGWGWLESRDALEALDGKLGPQHTAYVGALVYELGVRLDSGRDRYTMRPGESLWGAFRTAFFLGRIGDPSALPLLERASTAAPVDHNNWESASRCMLLRWYASAARALIAVQQLPAEARPPAVEAWIRHCFSSPEEHYMARTRLLPYLCDLLGDAAPAFLDSLTLSDPWMVADAKQLARGQAPESQ